MKITIILCFFVIALNGQQFSLPTQIERNMLYINPAYAGSYEAAVASLMHRSQWMNVDGALSFQNFEVQAPLKKQSIALGFQARHEAIGLKNNTEAFLSYAHRIRMENSNLAFGIKLGVQNINYGNYELQNTENVDQAFVNSSSFIPNFGFGVGYYSKNYFAGFSIPYFFGIISDSDGNMQIDHDINRYNFVFSGGGKIPVNSNLRLEPVAAFLYSTTLKPQLTAIFNFNYNNMFVAGAGYRLNEAVIFNAGYLISRQFSVSYSYDYNIAIVGGTSNGSHELGLLYYFGYKVNTINPRDF